MLAYTITVVDGGGLGEFVEFYVGSQTYSHINNINVHDVMM